MEGPQDTTMSIVQMHTTMNACLYKMATLCPAFGSTYDQLIVERLLPPDIVSQFKEDVSG